MKYSTHFGQLVHPKAIGVLMCSLKDGLDVRNKAFKKLCFTLFEYSINHTGYCIVQWHVWSCKGSHSLVALLGFVMLKKSIPFGETIKQYPSSLCFTYHPYNIMLSASFMLVNFMNNSM